MELARHKDIKDAKLYVQDIASRLVRSQYHNIGNNEVGTWKPINLMYDCASNQVGYENFKHLLGDIHVISKRYVTETLLVGFCTQDSYHNMFEIAERNWMYNNTPKLTVTEVPNVPADTIICYRCKEDTVPKKMSPTVMCVKDSGKLLPIFLKYKNLKGISHENLVEKVRFVLSMYNQVTVEKSLKLDSTNKAFYYRHHFSTIGRCVVHCYYNSIDGFIFNLPKRKLTRFVCTKCTVKTI